jgi:aryl-alcohol dehydrogenase-like predicted oxidoreductase
MPKVTDHPAVIALAGDLAVTSAQVALAWLLARYDRTLLIAGTSRLAHLDENIAAGRLRLPPAAVAELNQLVTS